VGGTPDSCLLNGMAQKCRLRLGREGGAITGLISTSTGSMTEDMRITRAVGPHDLNGQVGRRRFKSFAAGGRATSFSREDGRRLVASPMLTGEPFLSGTAAVSCRLNPLAGPGEREFAVARMHQASIVTLNFIHWYAG